MMNRLLRKLEFNKLLIGIVIVGTILRFANLSTIPISLNHDETAIGYNAYSILKTGADEYGKLLPISLKSFGDWKLPLYPLLDILPIATFGLNEFAVRLPSAIAGVLLILLIYIFSNQIFKNKKISLTAGLFLAISPWGIFFSRIAYEANVATALFLAGLICFIKFYYERKSEKWLVLTSFLWGLTIFTYHAFVIFTPLFFIGAIFLTVKKAHIFKNKYAISAFLVFAFFVSVSIWTTLAGGSVNKLSSTSLFDDQQLLNDRVNILRGDKSGENNIQKKLLHNKYSAVFYQIGQNYISTYSPSFLFDKGGEKFLHNIGTFGNFYLIDALFLVVGFIALFYNREKKIAPLILWLLVGPIPSAITKDSPSSTRLFLLLPAFLLISSYGFYSIFKFMKGFKRAWFFTGSILIVSLLTINFIYFFDAYFIHMNYQKAQYFHYGYKEAVELANKYPNFQVEMYDPTNFPYISFLFFNKYDPLEFRKEVKYYPENFGPFYYVKSFGRFHFVDNIDYEHLKKNVLYIDYRGIRNEDYKILDPSGNPVFKYFFK